MFITWDPATKEGDYTCKIYWRKGKHGNVYIEKVEYLKPKEVKKVKKSINKIPYFEMKVVKVEKEICHHNEVTFKNGIFRCNHCGQTLRIKRYDKNKRWGFIKNELQPKGNWVNGENLDAIKFPVPCSYIEDKKKHIGILNCYVDQYRLYNIEKQSKDNFVDDCTSLKNLINSYDIHILKGKIIIFEEEI